MVADEPRYPSKLAVEEMSRASAAVGCRMARIPTSASTRSAATHEAQKRNIAKDDFRGAEGRLAGDVGGRAPAPDVSR